MVKSAPQMLMNEPIDYLIIGHVSKDIVPNGYKIGGTAAYSGRTAHILGCRTAVLTSATADFDLAAALPGIQFHRVPAAQNTTFDNIYTENGRSQILHSIAAPLTPAHVPAQWQRAPIVHLGPIASEIDPAIVNLFSNSLIGLTPQGWLRRWDADGRVYARDWEAAAAILPQAAAVIISEEDLLHDAMLAQYRRWSRLLVLTRGRQGCTVFLGDESRDVPALRVPEVEFTGAGDIFAAAYFVRLWQTGGNPWESARFANEIAAQSVTQPDLESKMEQVSKLQVANK